MNTLDLASKRVALKKVSGTHGGEWQGPCPDPHCLRQSKSGPENRFHVWPEQNEGKGGYWCRGCGRTGDNIQFLRDFEGLSFREACARLNITLPDRPRSRGDRPAQHAAPEFVPDRHIPPADLWQEKAEKFIAWAQWNLTTNAEVLAWLSERGISAETSVNFRLGWNPGENDHDIYRPRKAWGLPEALKDDGRPRALWIPRGLVIPWIVDGVIYRIRIRRPEGEPRYYVLPGSSMATMLIGRERRAFVVVEAELDAIAVAACNPFLVGSVGLGSASAKPDADACAVLQGALQILNALDYDAAGAKAMQWWTDHFDHCDRWPVPQGKDPGEAVKLGIDLKRWVKAGLPPALTIGEKGAATPDSAKSQDVVSDQLAATTTSCGSSQTPANPSDVDPSLPAPLLELRELLRKNPSVKIINEPGRYTVLRDGKWVGGRISELVFRSPEVRDYIAAHPAREIDGNNLI